ncbi:MAG: nucleotidyltransferase substrate binding protein [Planctomycetaceae bacterium]|jgi:nucleotidyltransferase substrate binding protein (TIGR01987 family)|nr:nucleotidyltransferase substrate binding protein [Planctomycetaceae bacterium]
MASDLRWQLRFQNYRNSLRDFKIALQQEHYSVLERAGLIQLFEVSFELAWKTLKDVLTYSGYIAITQRVVIRTAFEYELIDDADVWLEALDSRNKYSHIYDQKQAEISTQKIKEHFATLLLNFEKKLEEWSNES